MDPTKVVFTAVGLGLMSLAFFASGHVASTSSGSVGRDGTVVTGFRVSSYAKEACLKAMDGKVSGPFYTPEVTPLNANGSLLLNWTPTMSTPHDVKCRFEPGQGVAELTIDGNSLGAVSVNMAVDNSVRVSGKAEKHWGHW